jgi:type III pantothenate kinase
MTTVSDSPLLAVDIGNSRIKFGLFDNLAGQPLPTPADTLSLSGIDGELAQVERWLADTMPAKARWWIASVSRPSTTRLIDWLREREAEQIRLLASFDLPLKVALPRPDMVGIDRLAGAVAANVLRPPGQPAVILDLVSGQGEFLGGAILPGIGMSARALHEFTDLLPLLDMETLSQPPEAVGKSTIGAMQSGLFWGAIGASKQLIEQFTAALGQEPCVFLTGGAAASVASLISPTAVYAPHLVLAGIAIAVGQHERVA